MGVAVHYSFVHSLVNSSPTHPTLFPLLLPHTSHPHSQESDSQCTHELQCDAYLSPTVELATFDFCCGELLECCVEGVIIEDWGTWRSGDVRRSGRVSIDG